MSKNPHWNQNFNLEFCYHFFLKHLLFFTLFSFPFPCDYYISEPVSHLVISSFDLSQYVCIYLFIASYVTVIIAMKCNHSLGKKFLHTLTFSSLGLACGFFTYSGSFLGYQIFLCFCCFSMGKCSSLEMILEKI